MASVRDQGASGPADEALASAFRGAMRRLASGVALVTTADEHGARYGIAMTALMSLSMEPPSLLLAVNQSASLRAPLVKRGIFGVSILSRNDEQACRDFVTAPADSRFAVADWTMHESGVPLLASALAAMVCKLDKAEPFGSHMVIRGLVDYVALHPSSDALVFLDGRYGRMMADE